MGCAGSSEAKTKTRRESVSTFAEATEGQMAAMQKAAKKLDSLPIPDEENPDDVKHTREYITNYTADDLPWHLGKEPEGFQREPVLRWLKAALCKQSELGPKHPTSRGYKDISYWLLANSRLWPDWKNSEEDGFVVLKELARTRLDALTADTERDVYIGMGLGEKLGNLGQGVTTIDRPRQDKHAGLVWPSDFDGSMQDFPDYVCFLRIAACALNEGFQAVAHAAYTKACGSAPSNKAPNVKGFMRMNSKLLSDHKDEVEPKPAANIDVVRTAWITEADSLAKVYAAAEVALGTPIRVKNNYHKDFDLSITNGYRSILANYIYDTGKTWGEMGDEIQRAVDVVRSDRVDVACRAAGASTAVIEFMTNKVNDTAAVFQSPELRALPAKIVCEIQFLTPEYYAMRTKTNAWYKIRRAENAFGMKQDYIGGLTDD